LRGPTSATDASLPGTAAHAHGATPCETSSSGVRRHGPVFRACRTLSADRSPHPDDVTHAIAERGTGADREPDRPSSRRGRVPGAHGRVAAPVADRPRAAPAGGSAAAVDAGACGRPARGGDHPAARRPGGGEELALGPGGVDGRPVPPVPHPARDAPGRSLAAADGAHPWRKNRVTVDGATATAAPEGAGRAAGEPRSSDGGDSVPFPRGLFPPCGAGRHGQGGVHRPDRRESRVDPGRGGARGRRPLRHRRRRGFGGGARNGRAVHPGLRQVQQEDPRGAPRPQPAHWHEDRHPGARHHLLHRRQELPRGLAVRTRQGGGRGVRSGGGSVGQSAARRRAGAFEPVEGRNRLPQQQSGRCPQRRKGCCAQWWRAWWRVDTRPRRRERRRSGRPRRERRGSGRPERGWSGRGVAAIHGCHRLQGRSLSQGPRRGGNPPRRHPPRRRRAIHSRRGHPAEADGGSTRRRRRPAA